MIVIADGSKEVATLGRFPLPIEVVPFGLEATRRAILKVFGDLGLPLNMALRGGSAQPFVTDGGLFILDAQLECIIYCSSEMMVNKTRISAETGRLAVEEGECHWTGGRRPC